MTAVARLEDVTYAHGNRPAVEDVSLTIEAGEFLGLVGPNGSGKTTLVEILLGLRRPDAGTVRLFGEPPEAFTDGSRLGYVPQDVPGGDAGMPITVREAVAMGRYPSVGLGRFGSDDHGRIDLALETVGIDDLGRRKLATLSGGQRQRVFIARALAGDADLLVLDEPTAGIDTESRETFYELLRDLNGDGLSVVLVEHDIGVVTAFASTVACINRRLFFHGDTLDFSESDALRRAYGANQRLLDHRH